jgi:hypothetical protein
VYLYKNKNFGEFGYVLPLVVGVAQHIGYATSVGLKYSGQKKYLKSEKHTQQMSQHAAMTLKQKELAAKQKLLEQKGQTELYKDVQLKKLVIITFVTLISVTVIGLGTYYALSVGGDDE